MHEPCFLVRLKLDPYAGRAQSPHPQRPARDSPPQFRYPARPTSAMPLPGMGTPGIGLSGRPREPSKNI